MSDGIGSGRVTTSANVSLEAGSDVKESDKWLRRPVLTPAMVAGSPIAEMARRSGGDGKRRTGEKPRCAIKILCHLTPPPSLAAEKQANAMPDMGFVPHDTGLCIVLESVVKLAEMDHVKNSDRFFVLSLFDSP